MASSREATARSGSLAGRLGAAETVLDRVAPFLIAPDLRGAFCRLRALVLWERGRLEEAHGLLRQAVNRFAEAGQTEELRRIAKALRLMLEVQSVMEVSSPTPLHPQA